MSYEKKEKKYSPKSVRATLLATLTTFYFGNGINVCSLAHIVKLNAKILRFYYPNSVQGTDTLRTETGCWLTHPCFQLSNSLGERWSRKAIIQICSHSIICLEKINRYSLPVPWMASAASRAKAVQLPQSHVYAWAPRRAADPTVAPGGILCQNSHEQIRLWSCGLWFRIWGFMKQFYFCKIISSVNELARTILYERPILNS